MFREKKEEFQGEFGMFTNLDKTMVIQDAQVFNESPLNYRKCRQVLTKLLYLLYQSETLTSKEATTVFFASTKAFQCKDSSLRRLTYLVIKELAGVADDVIIVTSSLTQDINSKETDIVMFKANAIRALSRVIDASMVAAVERFLKQAIVEKDHSVASSSIVSAVHFFGENKDVIRRWLAEIQQALNSATSKSITQYHALGLLYLIKQNDKMGLMKLVQQIHKGSSNPLAICMFLRIYAQLLVTDPMAGANPIDLKPYLRQTGPKGELVGLEAAKIICERAGDIYAADVDYTINALQMFLGSSKTVVRFSALRILNDLASRCPERVALCNQDIESLVTHPNRNIATLAITALLKTGDENAVDRLIKQIQGYVGEISDEFKVIVVDAVRALCLKFPSKHEGMLEFLGNVLREGGAYEYKQATVDAICQIIDAIPAAREAALMHLCEFIEDSEYPSLTAQILHLLGALGPQTKQPSKLIRYIYNRLVLEDALVRVAAVGALTKFALEQPSLKGGIISILRRCLSDPDDDVRDRAVISLQGMERAPSLVVPDRSQLVPNLEALEERLLEYTQSKDLFATPFALAGLPMLDEAELFGASKKARFEQLVPSAVASPKSRSGSEDDFTVVSDTVLVTQMQEFASFGPLIKSTPLAPLTDSGAEYTVVTRKHLFPAHVVLEFICTNTVPGVLLSNVSVAVSSNLRQSLLIPIKSLPHGPSSSCFVAFDLAPSQFEASFDCVLQFITQECDPDTNAPLEDGYNDKYPIESVALGVGDFLSNRPVSDWAADWAQLSQETVQTFALGSLSSLHEAVAAIIELYGLKPLGGTAAIDPTGPVHTLLLAGSLGNLGNIAIRCRMAMSRNSPGVSLELAVRAQQASATAAIIEALG